MWFTPENVSSNWQSKTMTSCGDRDAMLPSWRSRNNFWFSQTSTPNVHCTPNLHTLLLHALSVRSTYDLHRVFYPPHRMCVCVFAKNTYECRDLTSLWVCRARIYWKWNACASVGWFGGVSGMRALFFFALNLSMCEHAHTYILFCRQHAILVARQFFFFKYLYYVYKYWCF